jgi:hypothetical protein
MGVMLYSFLPGDLADLTERCKVEVLNYEAELPTCRLLALGGPVVQVVLDLKYCLVLVDKWLIAGALAVSVALLYYREIKIVYEVGHLIHIVL